MNQILRGGVLALIVLLTAVPGFAQSSTMPLDSLLRPDGTIRLDGSFEGTLDPSGYRMLLDPKGHPRFARTLASATADTLTDSLYKNYPGDEYWSETFGPPGSDGPVNAMAVLGGKLYVGGQFTVTGNTIAYNISQWDGRRWMQLRAGVNGTVRAMTTRNGVLYVGGSFTTAGGETVGGVARYYPAEDRWAALGRGVGVVGPVGALAFIGEDLYVGGNITHVYTRAGQVRMQGIARWTGVYWEDLGGDAFNGTVNALAVADTDLYVAGSFGINKQRGMSGIARWDGSKWHGLDSGLVGIAYAVIANGDDVYVGGSFYTAGTSSPATNIARWNRREKRWYTVGGGLDNAVLALAHDGRNLFAGGKFQVAPGKVVNYIARFDGGSWSDLAGGVSDTVNPSVDALLVGPDGLYAGGHFIVAGSISAHHIARWDGERWHALTLGGPLDVDRNGTDGSVYAMAVRGADLYVAGDFEMAGGIPARRIAKWDGEAWSALGSGIGGRGGFVRTLAVAANGDLYAGGIFDEAGGVGARGVARWNGTEWSALGAGVGGASPFVFALNAEGDTLFVGGAFTEAGGIPASRIAQYRISSGTWGSVGSGLSGDSSEYVYVQAITRYRGALVAGGEFSRAGGARARRIARWDGTRWSAIARGLDTGANGIVHALIVHDDRLYAGGAFTRLDTAPAAHIAVFDGTVWTSVLPFYPLDGPVHSFAVYRGRLVAVGAFRHDRGGLANHLVILGQQLYDHVGEGVNAPVHAVAALDDVLYAGGEFTMAGRRKAGHIAAWDDVLWTTLGSDPTSGVYGIIRTVRVSGKDVYVGGSFSAVGGVRARNIARWDGERWHSLGRGRANGVNGTVLAIEEVGERVFVGGYFTRAGEISTPYLAQWDGTLWSGVGGGVAGDNPYVFALLGVGDDLYAGGAFASAGGLPAHRVARWSTTQSRWHTLDSGVSGGSYYTYVSTLASNGRDLFVGGNFGLAGDSTYVGNVARWDGTRWHAVGGGFNNSVFDLALVGDRLFACGDFTKVDGETANYTAGFDGARWYPLGDGLNLPAVDMCEYQGELFVAGHFQIAGTVLGMGVARWDGKTWGNLGKGVQHGYSVGKVYGIDAGDSGVFVGGDFTIAGGRASYYFGRWNRPAGTALAVEIPPSFPQTLSASISLAPNPASGEATFEILLPGSGRVTIDVIEIGGRVLRSVECGILNRGPNAVSWTADDIPPGHYIARARGAGIDASTLILVQR